MTADLGITSALAAIWNDFGEAATWRGGGAHSIDSGTFVESEAWTETSLEVVRRPVTWSEFASAGGELVRGDEKLLVRIADLAAAPAADDQVVVGSATWFVVRWEKAEKAGIYRVFVRKL